MRRGPLWRACGVAALLMLAAVLTAGPESAPGRGNVAADRPDSGLAAAPEGQVIELGQGRTGDPSTAPTVPTAAPSGGPVVAAPDGGTNPPNPGDTAPPALPGGGTGIPTAAPPSTPSPTPPMTPPTEPPSTPPTPPTVEHVVYRDAYSSVQQSPTSGGLIYQAGVSCGPTRTTITAIVEHATRVAIDWEIVWPNNNRVYGSGSANMTQVAPNKWQVTIGNFSVEPDSTDVSVMFRAYNTFEGPVWKRLVPSITLHDQTRC